jgi:hypothetical protein
MLIWVWAIVVALGRVAGGTFYIRLRWHQSPQAYRAMLVVAACYFVAGALVGAWGFHRAMLSLSERPAARPTPLALAPNTAVASRLVGYGCGSDRWTSEDAKVISTRTR